MSHIRNKSITERAITLLYITIGTSIALWMILGTVVQAAPSGTRYYVDQNVDPGVSDYSGTSWTLAFTSVQSALDIAVSGDEIWVAQGEYVPSKPFIIGDMQSKAFSLTAGIQLYGGFAGGETELSARDVVNNKTVLSGDLGDDDTKDSDGVLYNADSISGTNAYHVVIAWQLTDTVETRLDGFTITGGQANGAFSFGDEYEGIPIDCGRNCGAGIHTYGSDVTYANLIVRGNYADLAGGIYNNDSQSVYTNILVQGNEAPNGGAGVKNTDSDTIYTNIAIIGNYASLVSGSGSGGSGIFNFGSDVHFVNLVMAYNQARFGAGGLFNQNASTTYFTNTIIWENTSNQYPNDADIRNTSGSNTIVAYSLISGTAAYTGTGNVTSTVSPFTQDASPGADGVWGSADDDYGDLTLMTGAVAIDAGNNSSLPSDTADLDMDGNTTELVPLDLNYGIRILTGTVDMGPYESDGIFIDVFTPTLSLSIVNTTTVAGSWDDTTGCSFAMHHSDMPFSGFSVLENNVSSPYNGPIGYYYVAADCSGIVVNSNLMGSFQFELKPGS